MQNNNQHIPALDLKTGIEVETRSKKLNDWVQELNYSHPTWLF